MQSLSHHSHEEVIQSLLTAENLAAYKQSADGYQPHWLPRVFGTALVWLGNTFFGHKPSYGKFKAVEVIARLPYQSWEVASYMWLTFFYANEQKAINLSRTSRFSRAAQDNETMHVIVISQLAKKYNEDSFFLHTFLPLAFSFFYFAGSFVLYIINPKYSFELNYMFESHAFDQYQRFLDENKEDLQSKAILSDFLSLYGRFPKSEYEFFETVRNDELVHRNASVAAIETLKQ
jgi:hypothetical protein